MVAGPLTGAEGDEQMGESTPDLRLWPEFGIPAQRAEQTTGPAKGIEGAAADADQDPQIPGTGPADPARTATEPAVIPPPRTSAPREQDTVDTDGLIAGIGAAGAGGAGSGDDESVAPGPRRARGRRYRSSMRAQTSTAIAVLAAFAIIFLVLHRFVPDAKGVGSLLETWLPWIGVPVGVLLVAACIVHTRRALVATLVAAAVWTVLYGPALLPRGSSAPAQLRVFSEDVNGNSHEATASGAMALAQHADVVALEDMYSAVSASSAVTALNNAYANHVTEYGFGLWSRYRISEVTPITLSAQQAGQSQSLGSDDADLAASSSAAPVIGALEASLVTPHGTLVVYLVHLPQPVLGSQGFAKARDQAFSQFVGIIRRNPAQHLAVIGDINVAATDRQFSQLTRADGLTSAQQAAGDGYGFTWPAEFPIVRLDDVLTRGMQPLRSAVLPSIASGQTHLPIQVDLNY